MKKSPWIGFGLFWAGFFLLFWVITGGASDSVWNWLCSGAGALILISLGIVFFIAGLFRRK